MKDYRIIQGDVREVLATLPDESVHCVVTSPPYWGLRDYGTGEWDGGDAECDHIEPRGSTIGPASATFGGGSTEPHKMRYRDICGKCGAQRVDRQLGLEPTPGEFVQHMVEIFRDVRRVLRRDGVMFLNMGDSYANAGAHNNGGFNERYHGKPPKGTDKQSVTDTHKPKYTPIAKGLKPKDLVGMPWRVAFALQEDGWYLRSAITWCKRAPMPESVTDRPTSATEMIFLMTRSERYYYDQDAIREGVSDATLERTQYSKTSSPVGHTTPQDDVRWRVKERTLDPRGRNSWNYWVLSPEAFPSAHFATFPTEIPRRAILAGTSERGCCAGCGAPWRRVTEAVYTPTDKARGRNKYTGEGRGDATSDYLGALPDLRRSNNTKGWAPTCTCGRTDVVPATVLDPFSGAGTTALVALRLGRRAVGIELNPEYIEMSHKRIQGDPAAMNLNMDLREMEEAV